MAEEQMQVITFEDDHLENAMAGISDAAFNDLAFGAIELDPQGKILRYNAAEGAITGRDPKETIGRNFFADVAPCTNSPAFKGRFDAGVAKGDLNVMFEYVFDYNMRPTKVSVHMRKSLTGDSYWVFVKRLQKRA